MTTLTQLLFSYYVLRLIGIITFLYILKLGLKKFANMDLQYKKIVVWFYNIIKSIFEVWKK
jgi:hypothetical protein